MLLQFLLQHPCEKQQTTIKKAATVSLQNDKFLVVAVFLFQATVSGEIGDVIAGKLSVPEGKTKIFKSLGELETTSTTVHLPNDV